MIVKKPLKRTEQGWQEIGLEQALVELHRCVGGLVVQRHELTPRIPQWLWVVVAGVHPGTYTDEAETVYLFFCLILGVLCD